MHQVIMQPGTQKLHAALPPNVNWRVKLPTMELLDLYATCKGFICTAIDEDFRAQPA